MTTVPDPPPIKLNPLATFKARRKSPANSLGILLALLCALAGAGCQSDSVMTIPPPPADQSSLTLHAGDVVEISFPSSPDMDKSEKIRLDGKINLPVAGEVKAAGKTVDELQGELESLYAKDLANDQVVVSLVSSEMAVYVSGAVNKPGDIPFDRPITVLEAVMESGGFSYTADTGRVHLIRQSGEQQQTMLLDLRPALRGKPAKVVYLQAGDILYVPEKAFNF